MAYGLVRGRSKPSGPLGARVYPIESSKGSSHRAAILTVAFDFAAGDCIDPLLESRLAADFNGEIEAGRTYPQEDEMSSDGFKSYFLSYDLVIGFVLSSDQIATLLPSTTNAGVSSIPRTGSAVNEDQMSAVNVGQSKLAAYSTLSTSSDTPVDLSNWASTYAFSYYIKPNYPGRSSHLCNAGFVVPLGSRGLGLGGIAGRSFLYYGPGCGYRGSVFNLVYASNEASVRIWEQLGFTNIGRIPEAGRLKTEDGKGEEYVDAWVVHGDFTKIGQKDDSVADE